MAKKYHCNIVLKGHIDIIARPDGTISLNKTGNAGMTKGGTGDVLAGLVAALACKNDAFTAAVADIYNIFIGPTELPAAIPISFVATSNADTADDGSVMSMTFEDDFEDS